MRARDRPVFQLASRNPHQHFGRRSENVRVVHLQKIKIGRRIHLAQRAVQIERRDFGSEVEALREHDLKDVARGNVFLAALHVAQVDFASRAGMNLELAGLALCRFAPQRRAQSRRQFSLQSGNVAQRAVVGAPRTLARNIGRGHDVNLMAQMIERQQAIEEHQFGIGQQQVIFRVVADLFQLADHVVGKISNRACRKRRQSRNACRADAPAATASRPERCCLERLRAAARAESRPSPAAPSPACKAAPRGRCSARSARRARPIPAETRAVRFRAIARKAETGVSRSALTDFTTGTSVASRARRENCLKSGCSIGWDPDRGFGTHPRSLAPRVERRVFL